MIIKNLYPEDHPYNWAVIGELDLNPVLVHPKGQGVSVVDALVVKRS